MIEYILINVLLTKKVTFFLFKSIKDKSEPLSSNKLNSFVSPKMHFSWICFNLIENELFFV